MSAPTRFILAAFLASLMAHPSAALDRRSGIAIKFSGERNWTAVCKITDDGGDEKRIRRRGSGRKSVKSLALRNVTEGSCSVDVPKGTALKVSFASSGRIMCPFDSTDPCMDVFLSEGTSKDFNF